MNWSKGLVNALCLFCLCLPAICSAATLRDRITVRRDAGGSQMIWIDPRARSMCPRVYCHPVREGCQMVEAIVFRFRGVWCESCPYCLDWPYGFERAAGAVSERRRRSATDDPRVNAVVTPSDLPEGECPLRTVCPPSPRNCDTTRDTDIYWYGRKCWHCPVCFKQDSGER